MRAAAAILSACAALAVGACSDDAQPVRTVAVSPGAAVVIKAREYHFDPGRIVVNAGGRRARLRIVLENHGTLAHNIHVRDGERMVGSTPSFRPGEKRSVAVTLAPGSYDFLCTVADHDEKGMVGKVEVR